MANQEHLNILRQGVEKWNQWRQSQYPYLRPNGSSILTPDEEGPWKLKVPREELPPLDLSDAGFCESSLRGANLSYVNLRGARFIESILRDVNFSESDLSGSDLRRADLTGVNFSRTNLNQAEFREARIMRTNFSDVDLRHVKGLETVSHRGPSTVGIDTLYRSQGQIPEQFLLGAGVPETFRTNIHALVESMSPIDFYSCFISYSSQDQAFAERLFADLQAKGVRCWFAPHHMRIGDEIRSRIDESIRVFDKLLLLLSEHSIRSWWVKKEVETAFDKEQQHNKLVLFPIKLDDTIMQTPQAWAADIRRMRHIGDFVNWKHHDFYRKAFDRLLRDLKIEGPTSRA